MANKIERQLPNDINAEAAVLSAMMIDNYVVAKAIESLEEITKRLGELEERIVTVCREIE